MIKNSFYFLVIFVFLTSFYPAFAQEAKLSDATQTCLECHEMATPGIVADWKKSRHSYRTFNEAIKEEALSRRVSVEKPPEGKGDVVIGCAECHTILPEKHKDSFDHNGFKVHVVVTPQDCASCHPVEVKEYSQNIMSKAYRNLTANPVYKSLMDSINGMQKFDGIKAHLTTADKITEEDSCLYCHGTKVEVKGIKKRETSMGEMSFPVLSGWPSMGVGRLNPDGTEGSCASCHTRHEFSLMMARKPATCSECHKGPDVPAYKVYEVSKHGNIYKAMSGKWNFEAVPWTIGKDFTAPTCASCHSSLLVNESGEVIATRTHKFNDRLSWRLFGLVYAHAHPKGPDTTMIKNKAGLPLPTELTGESASEFLIDENEQEKRTVAMQAVCLSCHSKSWVDGHFERLDKSIETTNQMTLAATQILLKAWDKGQAKGLSHNDSIFNETIEKMWVEEWLFYANSTRFASAMAGADYGVFAEGRWDLSMNIQKMADWLSFLEMVHQGEK